jgi:hypothetical protein
MRRSVHQFAQIIHDQMRTVGPKLVGISLTRDANDKPKVPVEARPDSRDGILDDNCSCWINPQ